MKYTRSMFPMILGERYENGMACPSDPSSAGDAIHPVMQYIQCCGRGVVSRLVMYSVAHANVLSSRKFDTTFGYATNMLNSNTPQPILCL